MASGGALCELGLKKYSELMPSAGTFSVGLAGEPVGRPAGTCSAHVPLAGARLSHATIAFPRGSHWPTTLTAEAPSEWPAIPTRLASSSERCGLRAEKK